MSRAVDWLAALGGLVAGVLGTLAVAAKIYGGRNESDATVSRRREAEITDLMDLKDDVRREVEKQRDTLIADNEKLKGEIEDMRRRLDTMERHMSELMRAVAQADICALAPTCPSRKLP